MKQIIAWSEFLPTLEDFSIRDATMNPKVCKGFDS